MRVLKLKPTQVYTCHDCDGRGVVRIYWGRHKALILCALHAAYLKGKL
jgi:predicted metal-dependent enzyme (double-stranded beta helix superfamily)